MVIKVLKPGIEDILVADLNFIYVVARILEFLNPEISRTSVVSFGWHFPDLSLQFMTSTPLVELRIVYSLMFI